MPHSSPDDVQTIPPRPRQRLGIAGRLNGGTGLHAYNLHPYGTPIFLQRAEHPSEYVTRHIIPPTTESLVGRQTLADWFTNEHHLGHLPGETCAYWQSRMMDECEAMQHVPTQMDLPLQKKLWILRYEMGILDELTDTCLYPTLESLPMSHLIYIKMMVAAQHLYNENQNHGKRAYLIDLDFGRFDPVLQLDCGPFYTEERRAWSRQVQWSDSSSEGEAESMEEGETEGNQENNRRVLNQLHPRY